MKRLMFEKPLGMRDTLPFFYKQKSKARRNLSETILSYGYSFMDTPIMEYHDTVGQVSATLDQQLFKLLDQQGHTLVLRPDLTAPIARVAASQLKNSEFPLRLAYDGRSSVRSRRKVESPRSLNRWEQNSSVTIRPMETQK